MYVNTQERKVFLAAPKTGSTAVRSLLREYGFRPGHLARVPELEGLKAGSHKDHDWLTEAPEGWSVATTVRNHWDTIVSWWSFTYDTRGRQPFGRPFFGFLVRGDYRERFWPDEHRLWGAYTASADTIFRHETLEQDLSRWLGRPVSLRGENVSAQRGNRHYSEFYTPVMRDFIRDWYRDEIEQLGYTYEEV